MNLPDEFVAIAHRIVWCTVATVDQRNRPRSRVMHPVWFQDDQGLHALASARPTPLKRAHLAHSPYVSCSYWDPAHDVAVADCRAEWVVERRAAWERVASLARPARGGARWYPPPAGRLRPRDDLARRARQPRLRVPAARALAPLGPQRR